MDSSERSEPEPETATDDAPAASRRSWTRKRAPSIGDFMTEAPHSIGADQTLETAHVMMRAHHIRHLPVLRAGRLVGVLSQRDLYLVETLRDVDPHTLHVEEAMSEQAYCVSPRSSLARVAGEMAEKKYGCVVVMDGEDVVGIFTAVDALAALAAVLRPAEEETP